MKIFRSPWGAYAAVVQAALAFLFSLILLAPEASLSEKGAFALIGAILAVGAFRAVLMRVVQRGQELTVHGFLGNQCIMMVTARPEIIDDKVVAAAWAPAVIATDARETAVGILSGYGRQSRANRRVQRICDEMNNIAEHKDGGAPTVSKPA